MEKGYVTLTDKQSDLIDIYKSSDPISESHKFMIYLALAELERSRHPEPHKYTVEELRGLGGKPYYHVGESGNRYEVLPDFIAKSPEVYGYGKTWLAYDRPPEEEE